VSLLAMLLLLLLSPMTLSLPVLTLLLLLLPLLLLLLLLSSSSGLVVDGMGGGSGEGGFAGQTVGCRTDGWMVKSEPAIEGSGFQDGRDGVQPRTANVHGAYRLREAMGVGTCSISYREGELRGRW